MNGSLMRLSALPGASPISQVHRMPAAGTPKPGSPPNAALPGFVRIVPPGAGDDLQGDGGLVGRTAGGRERGVRRHVQPPPDRVGAAPDDDRAEAVTGGGVV